MSLPVTPSRAALTRPDPLKGDPDVTEEQQAQGHMLVFARIHGPAHFVRGCEERLFDGHFPSLPDVDRQLVY